MKKILLIAIFMCSISLCSTVNALTVDEVDDYVITEENDNSIVPYGTSVLVDTSTLSISAGSSLEGKTRKFPDDNILVNYYWSKVGITLGTTATMKVTLIRHGLYC